MHTDHTIFHAAKIVVSRYSHIKTSLAMSGLAFSVAPYRHRNALLHALIQSSSFSAESAPTHSGVISVNH